MRGRLGNRHQVAPWVCGLTRGRIFLVGPASLGVRRARLGGLAVSGGGACEAGGNCLARDDAPTTLRCPVRPVWECQVRRHGRPAALRESGIGISSGIRISPLPDDVGIRPRVFDDPESVGHLVPPLDGFSPLRIPLSGGVPRRGGFRGENQGGGGRRAAEFPSGPTGVAIAPWQSSELGSLDSELCFPFLPLVRACASSSHERAFGSSDVRAFVASKGAVRMCERSSRAREQSGCASVRREQGSSPD